MKKFRLKVIASYAILLIVFVISLYPIITKSVQKIVINSLSESADELISKIQLEPNDSAIAQMMKYIKPHLFFRAGIINDKRQLIYDTHTKRLFGSTLFPFQFTTHPEVEEALALGIGYSEQYSFALERHLVYLAKKFSFHNKDYIMRLAFPQEYIHELRKNFEYGFLIFSSIMLILFCALTALIFYLFTSPINQIIQAIKPYQEGQVDSLPDIQLRSSLKDEFSHLAKTLNSLSRKVKSQIETLTHEYQMRKDFVANASHELKTPITIIRGFAETLHDNLDLDKDTQRSITEKIVNSCKRMTKTIKNLLTLADIDNLPAFKLQPCNVRELIETCRASLLTAHPMALVTIHSTLPVDYMIDAEPELLEVAIYNLLDNAAKYSKTTPCIEVFLSSKPGFLQIAIQDTGIGIPEHDLKHIYQRFYTVNKIQSKRLGGSGLGLSIVKTIVNKHLGVIHVESTLGIGTTFTIILPENVGDQLNMLQTTINIAANEA